MLLAASLLGLGISCGPQLDDESGAVDDSSAATAGPVRLYRLFSSPALDHFYTTSLAEANNAAMYYGYAREDFESIYIYTSPGGARVPFYRYYSGQGTDHFYTTRGGGTYQIAYGYYLEGIVGYVDTAPGEGRVRLYRYYSASNTDHFYTTTGGGSSSYPGYPEYSLEGEQIWVYPSSAGAATPTPATYFNSDTSNWPPQLYNNPTITTLVDSMPPGVFVCPYYGQTSVLPQQTSTYLSNPASYSGVSTNPVTIFNPVGVTDPNGQPASFINFSGRTIGTWINSAGLTGNYGLVTFTPAMRLTTGVYPWADAGSKLSLRWVMNVFRASSTNPTATPPYMVNYVVIRNPATGTRLWLGAQTYDIRGAASTWVGYDTGTQMGIVNGKLEYGNPVITPGTGSATFQQSPWGREMVFDMVVTRDNLRNALNLYNSQRPYGAASWPTDDASLSRIQVTYFGLNPEVGGSNAQAKATLGATYRSITLSKIY